MVNGPVPLATVAFRLTGTNFVVPEVLNEFELSPEAFAISSVDPFNEFWLDEKGLAACNETVDFGSGILLLNYDTSFSITWTGEVAQAVSAVVSNHIPAGVSVKSSKSLLAGRVQSDLGLPVLPGDVLHKYNVTSQRFDRYTSNPAGSGRPSDWIGPTSIPGDEPVIGIAEAFFYQTSVARDWLQYDTGPPPRLNSPAIQAGGSFQMAISGTQGQRYVVQSSSDFVTWTNLATLTNVSGTVEFIDDANTGLNHRFYRAEVLRP